MAISPQMATLLGIFQGDTYQQPIPLPGLTVDSMEQGAQPAPPPAPATQPSSAQNTPGGSGNWIKDILAGINAPDTPENERVMSAWQKAEGGGGVAGGPTPSNYNWLNTTENWPGATPINSVGVKSYASYQDGIGAIVQNLTGGHYQNILDALRAGNDAVAVANAIANSPFGTGQGVLHVLEGGGNRMRLQ